MPPVTWDKYKSEEGIVCSKPFEGIHKGKAEFNRKAFHREGIHVCWDPDTDFDTVSGHGDDGWKREYESVLQEVAQKEGTFFVQFDSGTAAQQWEMETAHRYFSRKRIIHIDLSNLKETRYNLKHAKDAKQRMKDEGKKDRPKPIETLALEVAVQRIKMGITVD